MTLIESSGWSAPVAVADWWRAWASRALRSAGSVPLGRRKRTAPGIGVAPGAGAMLTKSAAESRRRDGQRLMRVESSSTRIDARDGCVAQNVESAAERVA